MMIMIVNLLFFCSLIEDDNYYTHASARIYSNLYIYIVSKKFVNTNTFHSHMWYVGWDVRTAGICLKQLLLTRSNTMHAVMY